MSSCGPCLNIFFTEIEIEYSTYLYLYLISNNNTKEAKPLPPISFSSNLLYVPSPSVIFFLSVFVFRVRSGLASCRIFCLAFLAEFHLGCRVLDADEAVRGGVRLVLDDGVKLQAALWMPKENKTDLFNCQ